MLNKLFAFIAKIAVGKQIVGVLAWAHNLLDGYRSEIICAVLAILYLLKITNVAPGVYDSVEPYLLPLLSATLADKASKVKAYLDGIAPQESPK